MLDVIGCPIMREMPAHAQTATIVVDAVLGTGLTGPANGPALDGIRLINNAFPLAAKVAIDIPSGLPSDGPPLAGEFVKTDWTVTFTAAKQNQVLSPLYESMGKLVVVPIGSPEAFCETNLLNITTPDDIRHLFAKRPRNSNKGMYGHVLVIGGSFGKSGAPSMAGLGSLRSGAGLVTVAVPKSALPIVAASRPELMTEPLDETESGAICSENLPHVIELARKMTVLAVGPGVGTGSGTAGLVKALYSQVDLPGVFDADALNILAGDLPKTNKIRVLTPHPGEMGRLTGKSTKVVQTDRLGVARSLAADSGATIVLKGDRTVVAFPDGETWVNPTGSPALATGGTGDVLTGMMAGMLAQHPKDWKLAVVGAVWLHGRCGELAGARSGEEWTLATDILEYLPEAMDELRPTV
jgi:ADP-dependent NAD(P)H-hydrate dehydratase / NAD(P)H-hydrate epimerase